MLLVCLIAGVSACAEEPAPEVPTATTAVGTQDPTAEPTAEPTTAPAAQLEISVTGASTAADNVWQIPVQSPDMQIEFR